MGGRLLYSQDYAALQVQVSEQTPGSIREVAAALKGISVDIYHYRYDYSIVKHIRI